MRRLLASLTFGALIAGAAAAQERTQFTRADSLRGTNSPLRSWWDVTFYDLRIAVNPADSTIRGRNGIAFKALKAGREMQIDLQVQMQMDSVVANGRKLAMRRDSNAFFVALPEQVAAGARGRLTAYYHGKPRVARNPPWDGGFIWR